MTFKLSHKGFFLSVENLAQVQIHKNGETGNVSKTFKYRLTYDFKYNDTILAKSTLYL